MQTPTSECFSVKLKANPRPVLTEANIAALRPLAPQGMAMLESPIGGLALMRDAVVAGPGGAIPLLALRCARGA